MEKNCAASCRKLYRSPHRVRTAVYLYTSEIIQRAVPAVIIIISHLYYLSGSLPKMRGHEIMKSYLFLPNYTRFTSIIFRFSCKTNLHFFLIIHDLNETQDAYHSGALGHIGYL